MKRLTTKEFIKKAIEIHGNKYGYSEVVYFNTKTLIKIFCPIHGYFEQIPNIHLMGHGCPKCKGFNRTTEEFIEKAEEIHGKGRYDYSLVDYINSTTEVIIKCNKCGCTLKQDPSSHLIGKGCKKCAIKNQFLTEEEIRKRFIEVHGTKYDYSLVIYKNKRTKVKIICPIHGVFEQRPDKHFSGSGCPFCAGNNKRTIEEFIEKARATHGDKYDYSLVAYKNAKTKIIITCKKHGPFLQLPNTHLRGSGCPKCLAASKRSKGEIELCQYIKSIYPGDVQENSRDIIGKKELDVYLPELNLAFEYNGDYHHKLKEEKYPGYHVQKKKDCEKKGIKLIEILDTQWRKNKEKLKKFIKETCYNNCKS